MRIIKCNHCAAKEPAQQVPDRKIRRVELRSMGRMFISFDLCAECRTALVEEITRRNEKGAKLL